MNESTVSGLFDEAKGKVKEALGETFDNNKLANEGAADQVKGHGEQTWGSVKDTAHDVVHGHESNSHSTALTGSETTDDHRTSHDLRSGITSSAAGLKESIQHGLDHITNKHEE